MNIKDIADRLDENGIPAAPGLAEKLHIYLELLREWNSRMDLTAVLEDEETVDRHFIDSLTVLKTGLIGDASSLIDVGTGAGFPGLVLAMANPELRVTLLDAQQKRLDFIQAVCKATGTANTVIVHARAEDGARRKELREQFDIAAARALAPVDVLSEYTGKDKRIWYRVRYGRQMGFVREDMVEITESNLPESSSERSANEANADGENGPASPPDTASASPEFTGEPGSWQQVYHDFLLGKQYRIRQDPDDSEIWERKA